MASRKAVTTALRLLACNFAGDVSEERVKLWIAALRDVRDEALAVGIPRVIREYEKDFIPPVAVVRQACGANRAQVDAATLIEQIDKAGGYNNGWQRPKVQTVREKFGDAVAEAYGAAGGPSRVFSTDETTREIAARDFAQALDARAAELEALGIPEQHKALPGQAADTAQTP